MVFECEEDESGSDREVVFLKTGAGAVDTPEQTNARIS